MTPLDDRYSDVLDGQNDPDFKRLVSDLDTFAQHVKTSRIPPERAAAIERALRERAAIKRTPTLFPATYPLRAPVRRRVVLLAVGIVSILAIVGAVVGVIISRPIAADISGLRSVSTISQGVSSPTPSSASSVDYGVPPVPLRDPAPGQLDVYFVVNMGGFGADRDRTTIGVGFQFHGKAVRFIGHEQLTCNGKAMPLHQQDGTFQLADALTGALEGKTMSCVYRVGNTSTTFSFTVPRAPVFRSPQDGASISRGKQTIVAYDYDKRAGELMGVVALGPEAKTFTMHLDVPGPMQAILDTSAFPAGPGSLSFSQALVLHVMQTGAPFRTLTAQGTANAMISVRWV